MFCFTCDTKCLCVKCLSSAEHKNHDVRSFQKGQELIQNKLDEIRHQINAGHEILELNLKKTQIKKQQFTKKIQRLKDNICQQIYEILEKLKCKQIELLNEVDGYSNEKSAHLEKSLSELQSKLSQMTALKQKFNQRQVQSSSRQQQSSGYEVYKEYMDCRSELSKIIQDFDVIQSQYLSPIFSEQKGTSILDSDLADCQNICSMNGIYELMENVKNIRI